MGNLINNILHRYDNKRYIIQNKARFIFFLCLSILVLCPMIISYVSYLHLQNPRYNYSVQIQIIAPIVLVFILTIMVMIFLIKGYFSLAGHLILIFILAASWGTMLMDRSDIIIRLDTIAYILGALTMMPIIVLHKRYSILIYSALNIAILILFMILLDKELNIKTNIFIDYTMDNLIALAGIGIITYNIFSINYRALEKAESEIYERKKAEEQRDRLQIQLLQSQKLESVGLLAGGVAHDFNNMLAAVQGFAELIKDDMGKNDDKSSEINEIIKASKKARDLTHQLLAFARVQPLDVKSIDVNMVISDFIKMLSRTLRENIKIKKKLSEIPCSIEGDTVQIEQVLLNLTLNAQDAMPDGGEIFIETSKVMADENIIRGYEGVEPGEFVLLTVSDNGTGIDKENLEKIFDPFYTTKEFGKGTGLGLSTVYGIVKQHRGMIHVYSEKDKGSTFKIYFPFKNLSISEDSAAAAEKTINSSGSETILAVEDNPEVRNLVRLLLKKQDYNVLVAHDANSAVDISGSHNGNIDLLITDVVIPGMNGMQLYEKIKTDRPNIKILYMSGYTSNVIAPDGRIEKGINFIQKPFSISDFTKKIRDVLDN